MIAADALLDLWERGCSRPTFLAALEVLSAVSGAEAGEIARLPIGERDAALMRLHRQLRGGAIEGWTDCPACGEKIETSFDVGDILDAAPPRQESPIRCQAGDLHAEARVPTTEDLVAVESLAPAIMREALLRRCLVRVWRAEHEIDAAEATPGLLDAAEEAIARADPHGDIRLRITCPACGAESEVAFDIASFVWTETQSLVSRIASDVHLLASAYGWGEADILAMSHARRQLYIRQAYG